MAAASYYGTADTQVEKPQLSPSRGPQATGMHPEGSTLGLSQELHQSGEEQRSFTQQGFNEEVQHGMPQQGSNEQRIQQSSRVQNSGIHGGQQQQQQMDNTNYTQGEGQQMYGTGEPAAVDNRDTITKCNDNPPDYMIEFPRSIPLRDLIV